MMVGQGRSIGQADGEEGYKKTLFSPSIDRLFCLTKAPLFPNHPIFPIPPLQDSTILRENLFLLSINMVRPLILAVALLGAQAMAKQCGTKAQCDQGCEAKYGKGYFCDEYEEPECYHCKGESCYGDGERYTDPESGKLRCCDNKGDHWTYDDKYSKQGLCCAADEDFSIDRKNKQVGCCPHGEPKHHYSYDPEAGVGHCCEEGFSFVDGQCVEDKPTPPPVPEKCGREICPDDNGNLGLEYGKCYRLKNAEGKALHLFVGDYRWEPSDNSLMWQFRVCRSTDDCSQGGTVGSKDTFVLNDVFGVPTSASDNPWWVCKAVHYRPCDNTDLVKKFTARKWCDAEHCGICLKGDITGVGLVCPTNNRAIGDHRNPNWCTPIIVEEVPCLADNPLSGEAADKRAQFRGGALDGGLDGGPL